MNFLQKISNKVHICLYNKPIVSRYISFNKRDIIYQCRCGKRKSYSIYREFGSSFPIETKILLSKQEYLDILNGCKEL